MDEKGFLINIGLKTKRILSQKAWEASVITGTKQSGNREFISLLATINALGDKLPPVLLYQGKTKDLQDTWVDELQDDICFFGSTNRGWTNDAMGLKWLSKVFCPYTASKSRGTRLLLVDGHSSHVNLAFLDYAASNRIVVLVLPPHSTHRLQPLDIGLFGPLAKAYDRQIQDFMLEYQGFVGLAKRDFYGLFRGAWLASFTTANIKSAFAASGIYPLDPERTIIHLKAPEHPPGPRTPKGVKFAQYDVVPESIRPLRRLFRDFGPLRRDPRVRLLMSAIELSMATASVKKHENKGLRNAIALLKKKSIKGKRLNLLGREEGGAQLFNPNEIEIAKQTSIAKAQADLMIAREQVISKQLVIARRQQEKRTKAERAQNHTTNAQLRANQKKQLTLKKEAKKAAKKTILLQKQLEQRVKSSHHQKRGAEISVSAQSNKTASAPSQHSLTDPTTNIIITNRSQVLKERIPISNNSSEKLVIEEEGDIPSLIVILKMEHPSKFHHIFKKKLVL